MECAGCTRPLHEGARFCEQCGTAVPGRAGEQVTQQITQQIPEPTGTWTYAEPDAPAPDLDDTAAWRYDDTPAWTTAPPAAASAPGATAPTVRPAPPATGTPWPTAPPPAADDTSTWRSRPAADMPVTWDDEPPRRSRTAVVVGAVTLVALVGLGGAGAWAMARDDGGSPLPTAPPSAPAVPTADRLPQVPSAPSSPPPSLPSVPSAPDGGGSGSGTTPSVEIAPAAATDPDAAAVADLLQRHFAAINAKDYDGWVATVTPRRSRDQTESRWQDGYATTLDRDVMLRSLTTNGSGTTVATVTFVSTQAPAQSPDEVSSQLCWTQFLPIEGSGSDARIGLPPARSSQYRAC